MKGIAIEYLFKFLIVTIAILVIISFLYKIFSYRFEVEKKKDVFLSEFVKGNFSSFQIYSLLEECIKKTLRKEWEETYCYALFGDFSNVNMISLYSFFDELEKNYNITIDEKIDIEKNSLLILFEPDFNAYILLSI